MGITSSSTVSGSEHNKPTTHEIPADTTHTACVKTGDKKGAGTDGNVYISFADCDGNWEEERHIDTRWHDDFERGNTDVFHLSFPNLGEVKQIKIRRDNTAVYDAWYLEMVVVKCHIPKTTNYFPVNRWINANDVLILMEFDSCLPMDDINPEQRRRELETKRELYNLVEVVPGAPYQIAKLPDDEKFTNEYQWDIQSKKFKLLAQTKYIDFTTWKFRELRDFENVYGSRLLPNPSSMEDWRSDVKFGSQRLSGCNPNIIKLCTNVPEHLPVTQEIIGPFLEGKSLQDVINNKKLYIVDLTFLAGIECTDDRKLPGPTALFYVQDSGDLVPVAIQLMPEPGEDNPIFLPSDPEYTWLAAKMWFNLADASYHQSVTHLGFTHLLMESVVTCTHRQLSPSHPVYRLMAPHFIFLLAINSLAVNKLVSPGGWIDNCMHIGRTGMFNIIAASWSQWNLFEHGNLPEDLKRRGIDDREALPNYHYRDDGLLLWNALYNYCSTVINNIYSSPEKLTEDFEIQSWVSELLNSKIQGIPDVLSSNQQLIDVITSFIFISSVGHAAANFCQYDEYGFPPNYPALLLGEMPKSKDPLTEEYIVKILPAKDRTLNTMVVTKILSDRGTNALGDFEVQYAFGPSTLEALERFKEELREIGRIIDERNTERPRKYPYLHPKDVPNAISI